MLEKNNFLRKYWPHLLAAIGLVNGLALCIAHYFSFRALWLDEAFVGYTLRIRSLKGLFQLLEYDQHFPRLYLSIIWLLQHYLAYDIWVLRLLPFLFGCAGVLLWSNIFWKEYSLSHRAVASAAVLLFVTNHFVFYYAGELKQYSADLFFSGYAFWFAQTVLVPSLQASWKRWILACLGWAWPIVLSFTYPFVVFAIITVFFAPKLVSSWQRLVFLGMLCSALFIGLYQVDLKYTTQTGVGGYWRPWYIQGETFFAWMSSLWSAMTNIVGRWWVKPAASGLTVVGLIGVVWGGLQKIRKNDQWTLGAVGGILFILMIVLAALQRYPAEYGRQQLFFFPFACALIINGVIALLHSSKLVFRGAGAALLMGIFALTLFWKIPKISPSLYSGYHWENIKPAIKAIDLEKSNILVYPDASSAQIKAFPGLSSRLVLLPSKVFYSKEQGRFFYDHFLKNGFYLVYAYRSGELEECKEMINRLHVTSVTEVAPHLYYFAPVNISTS